MNRFRVIVSFAADATPYEARVAVDAIPSHLVASTEWVEIPAVVVAEPVKPKRERPKSRAARWADVCATARAAFDEMSAAKDNFEQAMSELTDMKSEFEEWRDNLDGRFSGSALSEKLDAVCDLNVEVEVDLSDAEVALDEAEGMDLPLGFGRD